MINKSFDHLLDIILYPKQPPLRPHSYSIPIKASSIEHRTSKDPKVKHRTSFPILSVTRPLFPILPANFWNQPSLLPFFFSFLLKIGRRTRETAWRREELSLQIWWRGECWRVWKSFVDWWWRRWSKADDDMEQNHYWYRLWYVDDIFKKEGSSICPLSDARLLFAYCLHSHARLGHHHLKIRPYIMHYAHTLQSRPYTLHQRSTSLTALDTCTYNAQEPPFRVDHFIFSASLRRSILIRITIECVVSLVVSFYRRTCRIIIVFHLPTWFRLISAYRSKRAPHHYCCRWRSRRRGRRTNI